DEKAVAQVLDWAGITAGGDEAQQEPEAQQDSPVPRRTGRAQPGKTGRRPVAAGTVQGAGRASGGKSKTGVKR
ncbi:MAG: hypothetical protein WAW87_09295, partial [Candidatus Ferrigenium altingense]